MCWFGFLKAHSLRISVFRVKQVLSGPRDFFLPPRTVFTFVHLGFLVNLSSFGVTFDSLQNLQHCSFFAAMNFLSCQEDWKPKPWNGCTQLMNLFEVGSSCFDVFSVYGFDFDPKSLGSFNRHPPCCVWCMYIIPFSQLVSCTKWPFSPQQLTGWSKTWWLRYFLSPVPTCMTVVKSQTVQEFSAFPQLGDRRRVATVWFQVTISRIFGRFW